MILTADLIKTAYPCPHGFRKFNKLFPKGMKMTKANILLAFEKNLDINWFIHSFFPSSFSFSYFKHTAVHEDVFVEELDNLYCARFLGYSISDREWRKRIKEAQRVLARKKFDVFWKAYRKNRPKVKLNLGW